MKKTEWPIRWDLLLRYRLIETVSLWEGRLTTNHLCHAFGIGRQQASKDINTYLRELAPGNLRYDRHRKGYVPDPDFRPVVTLGEASEYEHVLCSYEHLNSAVEALSLGAEDVVTCSAIRPRPEPLVVRGLTRGMREHRRVEASVRSMASPRGVVHTLEPLRLVCQQQSWWLRAWHVESETFMLVPIHRIAAPVRLLDQRCRYRKEDDRTWQTPVEIRLAPGSELSAEAREIIESDYGMNGGQLVLTYPAPLAARALELAGLGSPQDRREKGVELINPEALAPWLPEEGEVSSRGAEAATGESLPTTAPRGVDCSR